MFEAKWQLTVGPVSLRSMARSVTSYPPHDTTSGELACVTIANLDLPQRATMPIHVAGNQGRLGRTAPTVVYVGQRRRPAARPKTARP